MLRQYRRPVSRKPIAFLDAGAAQGMTLLEIAISVGIFAIILAGTFQVLTTSQPAVLSNAVQSALQERARSLVDRMVQELRTARQTTDSLQLTVPHPTDILLFSKIEFERTLDMPAGIEGDPILDTAISYELMENPEDPEDDIDNNGNGVIDEKMLVRTQTGNPVIITRNVDSDEAIDRGELWFSRADPGLIRIRLTLFTSDPGKKEQRPGPDGILGTADDVFMPVVYRTTVTTETYVRSIENDISEVIGP